MLADPALGLLALKHTGADEPPSVLGSQALEEDPNAALQLGGEVFMASGQHVLRSSSLECSP